MCTTSPAPEGQKTTTQKHDFKDTLNLPKTGFSMRPGFANLEPEMKSAWGPDNGYARMREVRAGAPVFTLHDGPPYANGHLHMGHVLNKVLKDMVTRARFAAGYDARLRPGWDCHGLPVEWKVEEAYRNKGVNKDDVPVLEFRRACRDYAAHWVDVQREEFRDLGVAAEWNRPYLTMDFEAEAAVAGEFLDLVSKDLVYRSMKPVMWSPVEKTALAEAEVEYHDRKSPAVWVGYQVQSGTDLAGALLVAWTTTPWTLPSSEAVAFNPSLSYGLYHVERQTDEAWAAPGMKLVLSDALAGQTGKALRVDMTRLRDVSTDELEAVNLRHPLAHVDLEWSALLPCVPSSHVTDTSGTGLVHTAPAHGVDDYKLGLALRLPMKDNLEGNGTLREAMPRFGGLAVVTQDGKTGPANDAVTDALLEGGTLLWRATVTHSYPHSWRSGSPVLFRATPQWFAGVDRLVGDDQNKYGETMRGRALNALEDVKWLPFTAKNRLASMLKDRPDWVLSRQRAWGVPLTLFLRVDLTPDHPDFLLRDAEVDARVLNAFRSEGADAWYEDGAKARFLGPDHDPELYEQCFDVLDVWFDSGSSHSYALEEGEGQADLYLEGTDQHRGWFQASLLHSVATRGRAPFKAVLTHGFALDGKGKKMSKSVGNTVSPVDVVKQYGTDVMRLWVALADHKHDFRAGPEAFKGAQDAYRKMRNTMRFMLGALGDDEYTDRVDPGKTDLAALPFFEQWLLDRMAEVNQEVMDAYEACDTARAMQAVHAFCAHDLSSLYFDVRKDTLYCDAPDSPNRQAALSTLSLCLDVCLSWVAPVLVYSAEQAWVCRHSTTGVHLQGFHDLARLANPVVRNEMAELLKQRARVTECLEEARSTGLSAKAGLSRVEMSLPTAVDLDLLTELCLVAELCDGGPDAARATLSDHQECDRCRLARPDTTTGVHGDLCDRCEEAMA